MPGQSSSAAGPLRESSNLTAGAGGREGTSPGSKQGDGHISSQGRERCPLPWLLAPRQSWGAALDAHQSPLLFQFRKHKGLHFWNE